MKYSRQVPGPLPILCLSLGTFSAGVLTLGLFLGEFAFVSIPLRFTLLIVGWAVVPVSWKPFWSRIGWQISFSLFALMIGYITISAVSVQEQPQEKARRRYYETLEAAIKSQNIRQVQAALANYTDLDSTPNEADESSDWLEPITKPSERPLLTAILSENVPIAKLILDHGASPKRNDMFLAAGSVPMMKLLKQYGADFDDAEQLRCALWDAVKQENADSVAFLLHYGVDPNFSEAKDDSPAKQSLLNLARSKGNLHIAEMLKRAGAKE